jgi:hypothetical protein
MNIFNIILMFRIIILKHPYIDFIKLNNAWVLWYLIYTIIERSIIYNQLEGTATSVHIMEL